MRGSLLAALIFLLPNLVVAETIDEGVVHDAAHFGISFALTTVCIPLVKTKASKTASEIACGGTALALGLAKEIYDRTQGETLRQNARGILWDSLGVLSSVLTIQFGF